MTGSQSRTRDTLGRIWAGLVGTLGALAGSAAPAVAATYDPQLTWRTIETQHFRIHFHQREEALAEEFTHLVERVHAEMTREIDWAPRSRTEVVLVDRTDVANGFASTVPYNMIVIYVTAPQEDSVLSLYEDWNDAIFTHEYTHILHMDTTEGIVRAARYVVGRIASTNDVSPLWMIEGLATFQETRHTPAGRGRSPVVDMIKRTAVVEDDFPPLGNLDGFQARNPAGNLRYLFGQDLIQWVADHQGADVWTRWVHTYGGHIPFILPTEKAFGRRILPMYRDWERDVRARYATQLASVEALGIREGERVSPDEASCNSPSFSPDNQSMVWSCVDLRRGSQLWRADEEGADAEVLLQDYGAKSFTWRSDSQALVYASTHTVNRFNTFSDIYLLDLATEKPVALTTAARARDPEFSPDGSQLWMVTNRSQDTQLEVMTVDRIRRPVTEANAHTQFATPRFSPDGRSLALSIWQDGRRDLWLYAPDGRPVRRLTADLATDRDPAWSPDGRYLLFSSDRTGIPNVFAIDTQTERLYQLTNVRTGAARPAVSPDGLRMAYAQYSRDGWDIRILPFQPSMWIDRGALSVGVTGGPPLRAWTGPRTPPPVVTAWTGRPAGPPAPPLPEPGEFAQSGEGTDNFDMVDVKDAFGAERDYPFTIKPRRYDPLTTLAPRYWIPGIATTNTDPDPTLLDIPQRLYLSAGTGGADTLRHLSWGAEVSYRTDARYVGWAAGLTVNRWLPVFSLNGGGYANPYRLPVTDSDERTLYWENRTVGALSVSFPYTPRSTLFGGYNFTWRRPLTGVPTDADPASVPVRGTIGRLSAGWRYAWGQPTAMSVSREDGRIVSLVGSWTAPWLGTQVEQPDGTLAGASQAQITAEIREYVTNPWVPNHVLALRAGAGATLGSTAYFGNYQLGGNSGDNAFSVTPDGFRILRGYPAGADAGDMYWAAGAEYRFPIWRMDRGVGTLPIFFRYLSGAVFVDAGNAFSDVADWGSLVDGSLVGTGAELTLATVAGYRGGLVGRLGYAVGLTPGGYAPIDARTVYFQFGTAF